MTLDDFFTLTEMNNGLTAPYRVKELMAVMQKESDHFVKNTADSTRQWSAVASAIAATENKDCLDLFIELDGLHFMSKWLKDAQKFNADTIDSFVEESITHLLQALEKMHVDHEKLVGSEIWTTVQDLLIHNSSKVQDNARVLFESWKTKRDSGDAYLSDVDKPRAFVDDEAGENADIEEGIGHSESSLGDASISRIMSVKEKGHELTRHDTVLSTSSDAVHTDHVESAHSSDKKLVPQVGDEMSLDHGSIPSLPYPTMEPPSHLVHSTYEPCIPAVSGQNTLDTCTDFHNLESPSHMKQSLKVEGLPEKLGSLEECKMSEGRHFASSSNAVNEMKTVMEISPRRGYITGEKNSCDEVDSRTVGSDGKGARDDSGEANQCRSSSAYTAKGEDDFNNYAMSKSPDCEKRRENSKDLGTLNSEIEDGNGNTLGLQASNNHLSDIYSFGKKQINRGPDRKKSDVEIDYGIVDPLEVARQVAIEVERDYREQSYSSSEKFSEGNTLQHKSPDSMGGKESHANEGSSKEVANDPDLSDESSAMQQEESATSSENLDAEQTNGTQDMATSQVTEAAQEVANTEKGLCNFDLNQEVYLEDSDHPGNRSSTQVSIVSASRAAAAPGLPGAPLQFEGNLGWKGSAITSAFRPASPRRMPESDKEPSTGRSINSSKQRQGCLNFDLNVAGSVDARTRDLSPDKHIQLYSSFPCGESSVEMSSRKSENLELDLNHTSEDGGTLSDWRMGQFFPQGNLHHNQSYSSSSSKQPIRNIDLNNQPSFLNDSSDNSYLSKVSQNFNVFGGVKSDDSVISIMGTRVEVKRKDVVSHTPPIPNGRTPELAFDVNSGGRGSFSGIGSALQYAHSSVYGYNNMAPVLAMPFPSTIYGSGGPIPYMVDSRGAPVIPQIMGSASALPTALPQPPFLINMNSSAPPNGVGPSRSSFDLNSGMLVESGSKDPSGFGLFLNSAHTRSMDEQLRSDSQPTISGKRKEPDTGWETYPFKHYTPPWKHN